MSNSNLSKLLESAHKTLELAKKVCDFTDGRFTLPIDIRETDTEIRLSCFGGSSKDVLVGRIIVEYHEGEVKPSVTFNLKTDHWLMINRIAKALGELPQGNED